MGFFFLFCFVFLCFIIKFSDYCYIRLRCQHKSSRLYLSTLHFRKITLSCTMILLWEPTFLVHSQKEQFAGEPDETSQEAK